MVYIHTVLCLMRKSLLHRSMSPVGSCGLDDLGELGFPPKPVEKRTFWTSIKQGVETPSRGDYGESYGDTRARKV